MRRATGEVFRATIPLPDGTPPPAPGAMVRVEVEVKTGKVRIAPLTAMSALRAVSTALKAAEQARLQGGYAAGYEAAGYEAAETGAASPGGIPGAMAGGLAAAALAARRQAMIATYDTAAPVVFTATGPVPAGPPPGAAMAFGSGAALADRAAPGSYAPGGHPGGLAPGGSPAGEEQTSHAERLTRLQALNNQGLLSPAEYEEQRQRILNEPGGFFSPGQPAGPGGAGPASPAAPPGGFFGQAQQAAPAGGGAADQAERLSRLQALHDQGLLSSAEFQAQRQRIIEEI